MPRIEKIKVTEDEYKKVVACQKKCEKAKRLMNITDYEKILGKNNVRAFTIVSCTHHDIPMKVYVPWKKAG